MDRNDVLASFLFDDFSNFSLIFKLSLRVFYWYYADFNCSRSSRESYKLQQKRHWLLNDNEAQLIGGHNFSRLTAVGYENNKTLAIK